MKSRSHLIAVGQGVLVTMIWASSFVLVKMALRDVGPITVAGLRYFIAFLMLVPFMMGRSDHLRSLPRGSWIRLAMIGLSAYAVGNGTLFWGLKYLSATTGAFLLNFTPLLVLFAAVLWLKEFPTLLQIMGLVIALGGGGIFFSPGLSAGEPLAVAVVGVGLLGFTLFSIVGREVARDRKVGTLALTAIPLAAGGGFLLLLALLMEGLPRLTGLTAGIIIWLALVNTALAYIIYNRALRVLTAMEMNVLLNLTPLGTAILAWLLLGEKIESVKIVGMLTVIAGVVLVQWRRS